MAFSRQHALIAVMFLTPVLCCFVGIGAFVHILLAAEDEEHQRHIALHQQRIEELAELQQQLNDLLERAMSLRQKIAEIDVKIRELTETLLQANQDSETAEKIKEEVAKQRELAAQLLAKLSELQNQITQKCQEIEKLKREADDAGPLNDQLTQLQKQLTELKQALEEARSEYSRLTAEHGGLSRWREEEENKVEILARQSRPGYSPPVYVECAGDGVTIWPEGTQLSTKPDDGDRDRLLAAARKTGYVVFLIRPDGTFSFYEYRALVRQEQSIAFGWEPVDASWNLVYPDRGGR